MRGLLVASDGINWVLERIARATGWLFVVLVATIFFDVVSRKAGFQIPGFGSTRLQELEWHLHAVLFLGWLGYCYIRNVHIRIDIAVASLPARRQAWIEIIGGLVFAIPYCLVAIYFAFGFFETSYLQNESSDAPNGLPYRWIIKFALLLGLIGVLLAVVSTLCRKLVQVLGPPDLTALAADPTSRR